MTLAAAADFSQEPLLELLFLSLGIGLARVFSSVSHTPFLSILYCDFTPWDSEELLIFFKLCTPLRISCVCVTLMLDFV